jgi:hypothetical protein
MHIDRMILIFALQRCEPKIGNHWLYQGNYWQAQTCEGGWQFCIWLQLHPFQTGGLPASYFSCEDPLPEAFCHQVYEFITFPSHAEFADTQKHSSEFMCWNNRFQIKICIFNIFIQINF